MPLYGQKTKMGLGIKVSFYFFATFGFSPICYASHGLDCQGA
jgi:hypothetical protein